MNKTYDMGNNEKSSTGVFKIGNEWMAMTFTKSKSFKTEAGASKWYAKATAK